MSRMINCSPEGDKLDNYSAGKIKRSSDLADHWLSINPCIQLQFPWNITVDSVFLYCFLLRSVDPGGIWISYHSIKSGRVCFWTLDCNKSYLISPLPERDDSVSNELRTTSHLQVILLNLIMQERERKKIKIPSISLCQLSNRSVVEMKWLWSQPRGLV